MFKRKSLVSAGFPILFLYNRGSPDYTNITLYNANTELLDSSIYLSRFIPPILLLATLLYWYNQLIYIHNTRSALRRQFRNYKTSFFLANKKTFFISMSEKEKLKNRTLKGLFSYFNWKSVLYAGCPIHYSSLESLI